MPYFIKFFILFYFILGILTLFIKFKLIIYYYYFNLILFNFVLLN